MKHCADNQPFVFALELVAVQPPTSPLIVGFLRLKAQAAHGFPSFLLLCLLTTRNDAGEMPIGRPVEKFDRTPHSGPLTCRRPHGSLKD
jgi:hypothetical protein